jgi:hypothetical protein
MRSGAGFIAVPLFLAPESRPPVILISNNPRALEPESADLKPKQISANPVDAILIAARDNFIVPVNNLGFTVCSDRPQWPETLTKMSRLGRSANV